MIKAPRKLQTFRHFSWLNMCELYAQYVAVCIMHFTLTIFISFVHEFWALRAYANDRWKANFSVSRSCVTILAKVADGDGESPRSSLDAYHLHILNKFRAVIEHCALFIQTQTQKGIQTNWAFEFFKFFFARKIAIIKKLHSHFSIFSHKKNYFIYFFIKFSISHLTFALFLSLFTRCHHVNDVN